METGQTGRIVERFVDLGDHLLALSALGLRLFRQPCGRRSPSSRVFVECKMHIGGLVYERNVCRNEALRKIAQLVIEITQ